MVDTVASLLDPLRVVLVVADDGSEWQGVRDQLVLTGWQVELVDLHGFVTVATAEDILPPMDGVRAAVVMVGSEIRSQPGIEGRKLGLMIAYLQGKLGVGQVIGLVELSQIPFTQEFGLVTVTYPSSGPGTAELTSLLSLLSPASSSGLSHESRVVRALRTIRPEAWLVLGPLVALGAFLIVFGLGWLNWRAGGDDLVAVDIDVGLLDPVVPSSLFADRLPDDSVGSRDVPAPLAELPVRCVIDTSRHGQALPADIACDGAGRLVLEGFAGPWHNEISSVAMDSGVVGTVTMEPRSDRPAPAPIQLPSGQEQSLEPHDPSFGVDRLELVFGADRQRVVLRQASARGGGVATLTFVLGA
jgi:hypothetical protein